ncbi:MAG: hypothetical protein ACQETO_01320 [Pseudomonadota bacterium]
MSADQYRQTRSPDSKSKKARQDECHVKQQMTSHWDLDFLSREELEKEMAKGMGGTMDQPEPPRTAEEDSVTRADENPVRTGGILLGVALGMMAVAVLLLRS